MLWREEKPEPFLWRVLTFLCLDVFLLLKVGFIGSKDINHFLGVYLDKKGKGIFLTETMENIKFYYFDI